MNYKIFNSSLEEIVNTKPLFFIGISVGVKPMTPDIAKTYLDWAFAHSSYPVQILIADEIAKYNYLVFSHSTKPGALSRAKRDGDAYEHLFEEVLNHHFKDRLSSFKILRWNDISGERFSQILECVNEQFNNNSDFQQDIFAILDQYIERRGKSISSDDRRFLANYLLEEVSTLLDGIYYEGVNYRSILYPTYRYSGMSQLMSDIQHKRKHIELCESLDLTPTVMVESLIE